jgi:hypothetical protein
MSKGGDVGSGGRSTTSGTDGDKSSTSDGAGSSGPSGSKRFCSSGAGDGRKDDQGDDSDESEHGHDGDGAADEEDEDDEDNEQEDDEQEDEEEETEVRKGDQADRAESSNPASPVPNAEGNWHTFQSLMSETFPAKSKTLYLDAYSKFEGFLKSENRFVPEVVPSEISFLNYFCFLKNVKFWASTTIWSHYSRLNAVIKRKFGTSLNSIPSITDLLKSYSAGYRLKKSSVFTPQQARLLLYYLVAYMLFSS